jgi:predicted ATP-binding protein involved in virulence
MKIRKITIQNYQIFDNIEFDFTDENGNTLDTIVLAGINGTGKTSLIELIIKILLPETKSEFSESLFIELGFNKDEVKLLNPMLSEELQNEREDVELQNVISDCLNAIRKNGICEFGYEYVHDENDRGDLFCSKASPNSIPLLKKIINFLKTNNNFKIAYFHNNIFPRGTGIKNTSKILHYIDYNNFEISLKQYIKDSVLDFILENRNYSADELVKKRIAEINYLLKGLEANSRIIDIEKENLIFENLSGKKLQIKDLSDGEKQIYLRAILLNSLDLRNGLIFVDEPELSLHPTWQSSVVNLYKNAGDNNQIFLATHSAHVIGNVEPSSIFLLKSEDHRIVIEHPKYTKGHSITYVLSEIMDTNYRDTYTNKIVNQFLELIRQGKHETNEGKKLLNEINKLSPESEERIEVEFSLERYKAIGR